MPKDLVLVWPKTELIRECTLKWAWCCFFYVYYSFYKLKSQNKSIIRHNQPLLLCFVSSQLLCLVILNIFEQSFSVIVKTLQTPFSPVRKHLFIDVIICLHEGWIGIKKLFNSSSWALFFLGTHVASSATVWKWKLPSLDLWWGSLRVLK